MAGLWVIIKKPSQEGKGEREIKEGVPPKKVWWPPLLLIFILIIKQTYNIYIISLKLI